MKATAARRSGPRNRRSSKIARRSALTAPAPGQDRGGQARGRARIGRHGEDGAALARQGPQRLPDPALVLGPRPRSASSRTTTGRSSAAASARSSSVRSSGVSRCSAVAGAASAPADVSRARTALDRGCRAAARQHRAVGDRLADRPALVEVHGVARTSDRHEVADRARLDVERVAADDPGARPRRAGGPTARAAARSGRCRRDRSPPAAHRPRR